MSGIDAAWVERSSAAAPSLDRELSLSAGALMRLLQMSSAALPIGAFAFSHGLERAVELGWVRDASSAEDWIGGIVASSLGACDIPLLARLYRAFREGDVARARQESAWLLATRSTAELRAEDVHLGMALARVLVALGVEEARGFTSDATASHACLFALGSAHFQIPLHAMAQGYLFSWVEAQVGAAVKLVPLGQTEGQRILGRLAPRVAGAVDDGLARTDADIAGGLAGHAMASALHETQYCRLFRS